MVEANKGRAFLEARNFLDHLDKQAIRSAELLSNLIKVVDARGKFPELQFADSYSTLRARKAKAQKEKAMLLGYVYGEQGSKKAVILAEDGRISLATFNNFYRVLPNERYGRIKTRSKFESSRYLIDSELNAGDRLKWSMVAAEQLLDLIR